jgi:hypothetical protein
MARLEGFTEQRGIGNDSFAYLCFGGFCYGH